MKTRIYTLPLLLWALAASAQEESAERWYQIEVAVFTQPANEQLAAGAEAFRKDIQLSYGDHVQLLSDAGTLLAETNPVTEDPQATAAELAPSEEPALTEAQIAMVEQLLSHQPFVKLPAELRNLNETLAALTRNKRQRLLFHEAWRQPLTEPEQALAIVVTGGDQFDHLPELSGTISIGASRYLHLSADLWFTEFANNVGQGEQGWPALPAAPKAQAEEISDTQINLQAGADAGGQGDLWQQFSVIDDTYQMMLDKPYVITNLATLRQSRRMRSGEVHYIDHPKIGMLVFIQPYEIPALSEPAATPADSQE